MDGVLKSWAVPKGPSMDPGDKRLAIAVDDHAIEYGSYEGIIPEGMYGAGPVVIWDKGDLKLVSGGVREGRLEFDLKGDILRGRFALVRMSGKDNEWLLIKKKDGFDIPSFKLKNALTPERLKKLVENDPPCDAS